MPRALHICNSPKLKTRVSRGKKIVLIDEPHPFLANRLEEMGFDCVYTYHASRAEVLSLLADAFGLLVRSRLSIDRELLDAAPRLAFVARYGVGTEHIDLDYAAQKGISVFTSPEGSRDTVAEHALGMLLMLMNKLGKADREVRTGKWLREPNRGVEIKGKTVGILGYGNMGQAFARRLTGLECADVVAYDKFRTDYGDQYVRAVSLDELCARAEILSIHIPYMPENHHFIDGALLDRFDHDIFLINTARGTVLHTADLVERMEMGKVRGAALDVLEYEEMSFSTLELSALPEPFQYLCRSERTVLSPHIAGWSVESKAGHARVLAEKIEQFLRASVSI